MYTFYIDEDLFIKPNIHNLQLYKYTIIQFNIYIKYFEICVYIRAFLPLIINPTRVSNSSATVIDNIYSKFSYYQHPNVNIFSVSRAKLDLKDINIYQHNYSNFHSNSFRDDISLQKLDIEFADANDQFIYFYIRLDSTVERHVPL